MSESQQPQLFSYTVGGPAATHCTPIVAMGLTRLRQRARGQGVDEWQTTLGRKTVQRCLEKLGPGETWATAAECARPPDEMVGVRFWNFARAKLTVEVLDEDFQVVAGHDMEAVPFDPTRDDDIAHAGRKQQQATWSCGLYCHPGAGFNLRLQGVSGVQGNLVATGDEMQAVFVFDRRIPEDAGGVAASVALGGRFDGAALRELEAAVPGRFEPPRGFTDALAEGAPEGAPQARVDPHKAGEFRRRGGRLVEAPTQEALTDALQKRMKIWSVGIYAHDFLIPVCHQGMNRSQVMRLALLGAVRKLLCEASGDAREAEADQWVARAHGAVSGCDAHSAYERVDEQNFFAYIFDTGEIFDPSYCATEDEDPQRGPLQRGFHEAFGVRKLPRIGEEMARRLSLNPISDFTTPAEFARITDDRTSSHRWFDKYLFAPMDKIRQRQHEPDAPVPDSFTIPPPNAKRRIFFAFARAVPNLIDRLLEVEGGPSNTVIVSLQFDDVMNHELRHCQGKTAAELQQTMLKVHQSAYQLYTSILHVGLGEPYLRAPPPSMPAATTLAPAHALSSGTGGSGIAVETPEERLIARFQEMGLDSSPTGPGTCIALAHKILSKQWRKITQRSPRGREFLECEPDDVVEVLANGELSKVGSWGRVECLRAQVLELDQHGRLTNFQGLVPQKHTAELAEPDLVRLGIHMLDLRQISKAQAESALQLQGETHKDRHQIQASAATPTSGAPEAIAPEPQSSTPTRHLQDFLDQAEALGIDADVALQRLESKGGDDQYGHNHGVALAEMRSQLSPRSMAPASARPPERGDLFQTVTKEHVYRIERQDLGHRIWLLDTGYRNPIEGHAIELAIPNDSTLERREVSVLVWRDMGTLQARKFDVKVQGLSERQYAAFKVSDYVHPGQVQRKPT